MMGGLKSDQGRLFYEFRHPRSRSFESGRDSSSSCQNAVQTLQAT
jgi:hypothetical protein